MNDFFSIDNSRSYAMEGTLDAAIFKRFGEVRYLTVCNRAGRFTAVFGHAWNKGLDAIVIAQAGFMVVG